MKKKAQADITCLFYCNKQSKSIDNTPKLELVQDVAYIYCFISISGGATKLSTNSLIVSFPDWVEIQVAGDSIGRVNNNQVVVDFSKLICLGNKSVENATVDIKIGLIRNSHEDNYSLVVIPYLAKKAMYKLSCNKFEISNK